MNRWVLILIVLASCGNPPRSEPGVEDMSEIDPDLSEWTDVATDSMAVVEPAFSWLDTLGLDGWSVRMVGPVCTFYYGDVSVSPARVVQVFEETDLSAEAIDETEYFDLVKSIGDPQNLNVNFTINIGNKECTCFQESKAAFAACCTAVGTNGKYYTILIRNFANDSLDNELIDFLKGLPVPLD